MLYEILSCFAEILKCLTAHFSAFYMIDEFTNLNSYNPGAGKTPWLNYAVTHFKILRQKPNLSINITVPGD